MGYFEVPCQICGVSFNISRIRTKEEPRSAAFCGQPRSWVQGRDFSRDEDQQDDCDKPSDNEQDEDVDNEVGLGDCSEETGCCMVYRKADISRLERVPESLLADVLCEDDPDNGISEADPNYECQSTSDYEPLEYGSDAGEDHFEAVDRVEGTIPQDSLNESEWSFSVSGVSHQEHDTEFLPLSTPLGARLMTRSGNRFTWNTDAAIKAQHFEHIAGPNCHSTEGYLGMRISVEETRNCHTVQCILPKAAGWNPSPDDLDIEGESGHYLTGVADHMPSGGFGLECAPVRHGADYIQAETNFLLDESQEELKNIGLPFHPTCFEIFVQASRRFLGRVDIDALVKIRDKACLEREEFPVKHHQHVIDGLDQVWAHNIGHEYLAANPIFVPGLRSILEASVSKDRMFSVQQSPFDVRRQRKALTSIQDPFKAFPAEIILTIVSHLSSSDIAGLRLSSCAFTHLPISVWHRLIVEEVPWLYEAWSSDPSPYYWATVIAHDLIKEKHELEKFNHRLQEQSLIIKQEMPEIHDLWLKDKSKWEWPEHPERQELLDSSPMKLPYEQTNWYQLYCDITANQMQLKGLRNRARIWDAVMQMITAIRGMPFS